MKFNIPISIGDKWRVKTRFAWTPVRTTLPNKDIVIWLELYQTNDKYDKRKSKWITSQIADMNYWSD